MSRDHLNLQLFANRTARQFGGSLLKGNAKTARPLSTKHAIHLVLKSKLARGRLSLLRPCNAKRIESIVRKQAASREIRIYHFVNVGNHLHLVIRLESKSIRLARLSFHAFIRAAAGLIARHTLEAEKRSPKHIRFWQARPFTRLISWGRDFKRIANYMKKNRSLTDWGFSIVNPLKIANLNTS